MFFLFLCLSLCELRVSDSHIRLPINNPQEEEKPYQIITYSSPNVEVKTFTDIIKIKYLPSSSTTTVVKISVSTCENHSITTEIIGISKQESVKTTVSIDIIDHLKVIPLTDTIYPNKYVPIILQAYNEKGMLFTSLNGTTIDWNVDLSNTVEILDYIPNDNSIKKKPSNDQQFIVIKASEINCFYLTCKLTCRNIDVTEKISMTLPIVFQPNDSYLLQNTKTKMSLYYMDVVNDRDNEPKEYYYISNHENFVYKARNSSIANISQDGNVSTFNTGTTLITVIEKNHQSNIARAIVRVVCPDEMKWEEQWIKSKDDNSQIGPHEPNISSIQLFYKGKKISIPDNFPMKIQDNWKKIGTHNVNVTFSDINVTFHGVVHTLPPLSVDQEYHKVSINDKNYHFNIIGGSGNFDFDYDESLLKIDENENSKIEEQENGYILSVHSILPLKKGTAIVTVTDKVFNDYTYSLIFDLYSDVNDI